MKVDMHADILYRMVDNPFDFAEDNEKGHIDLPKLLQSGLSIQFWAVFIQQKCSAELSLIKSLQQIELFHQIAEKYKNHLGIIKSKSDIIPVVGNSKVKLLLSLEGGDPIGEDLDMVNIFYRLGVRSIGLTWNHRNQIADGVWEGDTKGGITRFGKKLINRMNDLGMLIDLAHISFKGFTDVLEITQQPIIVSHGNCMELCNHPRNLTDQQIRMIADLRGVIGVNFYPHFLAKQPELASINDVARHIAYIAELVGVDYVGVGSDFDGIDVTPKGLEHVAKISQLEQCLAKIGFNKEEIDKILGGNAVRIMNQILR